jgi:hypothetical protein
MMFNVWEGVINVVLLFFLLPHMAMSGYILVMYIKEIFNASLSIHRLSQVTTIDVGAGVLIAIILSSAGAGAMGKLLMTGYVWADIGVYLCGYSLLLYVFNAVTRDDMRWAGSLIKQ